MKLYFLKLRITLFFAVLLLFVNVFSNRLTSAKENSALSDQSSLNNLPAEFVFTTNMSGISRDVFQKINHERKLKKLKPMSWNEKLAEMAYDYSKKMAKDNFFDHYDNNGDSVVERANDYKIKNWKKIGENLFQCEGYTNPVDVAVNGWLKSPTHRRNIYDKDWTDTGIGVYTTKDGEIFITQLFLQK